MSQQSFVPGPAEPETAAAGGVPDALGREFRDGVREPGYDDDRTVRLLLSRVVEPDDQLFAALREHAPPAEVLRVLAGAAVPPPAWPEELAARFEARRAGLRLRLARADPEADLAAGSAVDARFVIPGDRDWPSALDDLGTRAPFGMWIIGELPGDAPSVAMVGARACTGYGSQAAGQLAAELAGRGVVIVSGAALGVDGAAHRGALAVGGVTAAVLACGIDRTYPHAHTALIQAIGRRGAVLAELPPGTSPTRFRFLARNRLIAALGAATVVVEAAGRSGSLVTARLAAELGRAVFAVPGPVTSRQSLGTNLLLCDGAIPALGGDQVLAELGLEPARPTEPAPSPFASPSPPAVPSPPQPKAAGQPAADVADPIAALVREALPTERSGRCADVLGLAAETGLDPSRVLAALGRLAARGEAAKTGGGWALR